MATQLWHSVCTSPSAASASHWPPMGRESVATATLAVAQVVYPGNGGNGKSFYIKLESAPGLGRSRRFQFVIAGVPSAFDITISDLDTEGSITVDVALTKGQLVNITHTPSGTPLIGDAWVTIEYDPTTPNEFVYMASVIQGGSISNTQEPYWSPLFFRNDGSAETADATGKTRAVAAVPGLIASLYVDQSAPSGAGNTWNYSLSKNGSQVAAADCAISGAAATTAEVAGLSIDVAVGDLFSFLVVSDISSAAAVRVRFGVTFIPDVPGQYMVCGKFDGNIDQANPSYFGLSEHGSSVEADVQTPLPLARQIVSCAAAVNTAPGAGNNWTVRTRVPSGQNGALSFTISDAELVGSDTNPRETVAAGSLINISITPVSTPDNFIGLAYGIGFGPVPGGGGGSGKGGNKGGGPPGGTGPPGQGGGGGPGVKKEQLVAPRKRLRLTAGVL